MDNLQIILTIDRWVRGADQRWRATDLVFALLDGHVTREEAVAEIAAFGVDAEALLEEVGCDG